MVLTDKTKLILSQKLKFTDEQIDKFSERPDLQEQTQNLIRILKLSPDKKEVRQYTYLQLRKIKEQLSGDDETLIEATREPEQIMPGLELLKQARSDYYSFKRLI